MTDPRAFWLPTRPYTLIDAINRVALATGSALYAQRGERADYNGHAVFADYRRHAVGGARWVAEYTWAGRHVISRGAGRDGFVACVQAGKREHARGALGSSFRVRLEDGLEGFTLAEQAAICVAEGLLPWSEEIQRAHDATYRDDRWEQIGDARSYERQGLAPALGFLANSATAADYKAKLDAHFAERRAARAVRS